MGEGSGSRKRGSGRNCEERTQNEDYQRLRRGRGREGIWVLGTKSELDQPREVQVPSIAQHSEETVVHGNLAYTVGTSRKQLQAANHEVVSMKGEC